jgi:hypothetical protein
LIVLSNTDNGLIVLSNNDIVHWLLFQNIIYYWIDKDVTNNKNTFAVPTLGYIYVYWLIL